MNTSKIIKGVVGGGRYTVTAPIIKEDYGLYLQIEGINLPDTYEVDFSNDEHSGTSVTMIGNADGVLIPSQFIKSGKDVFAFLYHVGDNYGRTVFKFRIPNKLRPDRTDEEPTPEQASTIDQAINALNTAVAKTARDVIDADASADRAEQAKDDASTFAQRSAQSAQASADYSESAQASAESASASASASAQSASQSAQIKTDVEGMADDAQGYADSARQSASQASASEQGCARAVLDAASAAAISRARAEEASGYAQTANTKASEASGYAQSASQKASEASQSASQALGYKTDAESAKTASQTAQGLAESARDSAITAKTDAESARDEAQNLVDGISGKVEQIDANTERIESLEEDRYKPYVTDTASGSIASFPDGADNIPLKSLVVDINPVQDLSQGEPSPDNICPISGWTEVNVNHSDADMTTTTITIDLGQTVYGGKLDVLTGKLVVDRAINVIDGSQAIASNGIQAYGGLQARYVPNPPKAYAKSTSTQNSGLLSDRFDTSSAYIDISYQITGRATNANVYINMPASVTTATQARAWFASNPTQVVYELAEPIEIQLSANQINSLYGVNNIFADTGDTHAEYRADTKLYIEKLTQPEEDDMIADSAITSGQFFMIGNTLYRALTAIASGATITVGTNAERVSLSDALNLVNA